MRKIIVLIFCLLPMYSSTYPSEEKILEEQPEIRLVKKLETFNKELQELQELIQKDEEL